MLSLLSSCHSPQIDDVEPYDEESPRRRRRSIFGRRKPSRGKQLSIGSPTDFKHEAHVGSDLVSSRRRCHQSGPDQSMNR